MATVTFDDYLAEQLRDDDFKKSFLNEKRELDKEVALMVTCGENEVSD